MLVSLVSYFLQSLSKLDHLSVSTEFTRDALPIRAVTLMVNASTSMTVLLHVEARNSLTYLIKIWVFVLVLDQLPEIKFAIVLA